MVMRGESASGDTAPKAARFGVGLPNDPAALSSFSQRAEELGFAGVWSQDSLTSAGALDGLHVLSFAAAATRRIRVGISVLYSGHRHPAVLAREIATIDRLSGGRLTVGIGVGNSYHRPKLDALDIPTRPPTRRLVEGIGVMRALWSEEEPAYAGEIYSFSGIPSQLKPVQQPSPPIWIGARAEPALRRAARIGDGWTGAGPVGTKDFFDQLNIVSRALDDQGRDRTGFTVSKNVYVAVESTAQRAREHLTRFFDRLYGTNPVYDSTGMADRVAVFGPPEECAEQLRGFVDAGVDYLVLQSVYDPIDQLEALGDVMELATSG